MTELTIAPEERGLAVMTHLSGLAGYIVPGFGVIVPIIIWITKSDSRVISTLAKQAVLLNVVVFLLGIFDVILYFTIILFPLALLLSCLLVIVGVALPVIGAIKANEGRYYRYPVVGPSPT